MRCSKILCWGVGATVFLSLASLAGAAAAADPNPAAQATCTTDDGATCVIQGHHEVPPGTVLDYGDRHVVLEGLLRLGAGPAPRTLTLRTGGDLLIRAAGRITTEPRGPRDRNAGDLTLTVGGTLTLRGQIELEGQPTQGTGGTLTLTMGGALTVSADGAILADGATGGRLDLAIGGDLTLAGRLKARGHPTHGQGGTITLRVAGAVTLTVPARLRVDGATAGSLTLKVTGPLTLDADVTADGKQGGSLNLQADGAVTLHPHATLSVEGQGRSGRAGTLSAIFCGPGATLAGRLQAVGEGGADGGTLTVQSRGPLTISGRLNGEGEGRGAKGGTIAVGATAGLTFGPHARLTAEGHPDGTITLAAPDPLDPSPARIEPPFTRVPLGPICGLTPLQVPRANHTATLLTNGTVLLAGGRNGTGPVDSLEQFNPATGTFSALVSRLSTLREAHSATVLPDGMILLLGGTDGTRTLDTADLFDPVSGSIAALGARLSAPRAGHTATLLLDGTVLLTGGTDGTTVLNSALLFDPVSGSITALGSRLSALRSGHTATLLPGGTVLLVGGTSDGTTGLASAELFNSTTRTFSALGSGLLTPRSGHSTTLLPDGTALILGGTTDGTTALASGELFDPASATFSPAPLSLLRARRAHTATLLGDGTLLVTGGFGSGPLGTAERLGLGLLDQTAPTVVAVRPPDQATEVPSDSRVAIRFSEPLNPVTLSANSFRLIDHSTTGPIDGAVALGEGALLAFLTPTAPLTAGRSYTGQLTSAIKDTSGNGLVPFTSTFTVQGAAAPLTLLPATLTLGVGQTGTLTIQLPTPAPPTGVTLTLESASPRIATVPPNTTITAGETSASFSVTAVAPGTVNVTVAAPGLTAATSVVTVVLPPPTVTGFSPTSGKVGTTITITGTNFVNVQSVIFNSAPAPSFTVTGTTTIRTTIPPSATTGPISVSAAAGTATSTGTFLVLPTQDVSLVVEPSTVTAIAGTSVSLKVSTVTTGGYTGLTQLSTGPLPVGVTATFSAPYLGPNASGLLTVTTSGSTPRSAPIEVRGTATIEGTLITRSATATLSVQATGQTVLVGQVLDENEKPIPGVSIKLGGSTITTLSTTDAAGNFLVTLPIAGPQTILIDGSTAPAPGGGMYFTIPVTVAIQPGIVNSLGFIPHLAPQPATQPLPVAPVIATPVTFPDVPDLTLTIPAGVRILGWDGQANTQIGARLVPVDRSPLPPLPAGAQTPVILMFSFGKVGGGTPTQPIPVTVANTVGAYPGQQVELWYYNEAPDGSAPNAWQTFGTGTVSSDGRRIVADPGVGIPRFCCGAIVVFGPPRPPDNTPPDEQTEDPCADCTPPEPDPSDPLTCEECEGSAPGGDPVETSSGIFLHRRTDLTLRGRLPSVFTRLYRTNAATVGPFGVGTSTGYDTYLRQKTPDLVILFRPGNYKSRWARQVDGSFTLGSKGPYRGARLTRNADATWALRYKDGRGWSFNSAGWLVARQDRTGNTLLLQRDSQNRLTAVREPGGRELTLTYSGTDTKIQSVTDPLGRTVRYQYDGSNRLTQVTDPANGTWTYTYDANHRMLTVTNPRSILQTQNTYDTAGRVATQILADGGVTRFAYTVVARTVVATTLNDPTDATRTYRFVRGYPTEGTDALGQVATTRRAAGTNLLQAQVDRLGRTTTYTHDAAGNVTAITDPLTQPWTFTYDPVFNQVLTATDPFHQTTTSTYDATGNLLTVTDPLNHTTTLTYNAFGQVETVTSALGKTTTLEYDSVGNLVATTDPLGHRTEQTYDSIGRLLATIDALGQTTRFTYDLLDRLLSITDPLHGVTRFTYDPLGNLLTVTDAKTQTTTHTYDPMNRLATRTDPLNRTESFTYDLNGNLQTATDRKGQVTTFTYDGNNRRIRTDYADGSSVIHGYDAVGNLLTATDSLTGPLAFTYDPLNRRTAALSTSGTVTYAYDPAGRRQTMQASGFQPVTYGYDATSRLTGIVQGPHTAALTYDPANRRTSLVLPNGITVTYTYDDASRLIAQTYTGPTGVLGDLTYTYDPTGNRLATGGSFARSGLPAAVLATTYDPANQQLAFGDVTQTFDPNGNLLTQTDATGTTAYTWDARNRLVAISGPTVNAAFAYDALGRRIGKTINGQSTSVLYDGLDTVWESGPGGDATYLRTLAIDEALARTDGTGTATYLTDTLGSTVALADSGAGVVTEYAFAPFGKTAVTGSPSTNPFQFTGRENDGTGLYYYRARYYDPGRGRFVNEDPIGFAGGDPNLYGYVWNNPLSWIDPLGLAMIGSRPLDSKWLPLNGRLRLRHDQIWYDDGQNSGFFDDDTIRPDRRYTRGDYDFQRDPRHYDDALMREAERNIQRNWDMDWRVRNNNCQHYADAARKEYERLKRERERRQLMK